MKLWIDADSCPTKIRDVIIRACKRLSITAFFVANRQIPLPRCDLLRMIITENVADGADNYIVDHASQEDMAITRDIPLAARLVEKNITVLNDRGTSFTAENIREKLSLRDFNLKLYNMGYAPEKTGTFGKKELTDFANAFDRELRRMQKNAKS